MEILSRDKVSEAALRITEAYIARPKFAESVPRIPPDEAKVDAEVIAERMCEGP
jgi:hypothetical protein